jgi:hypothetical protein
MTHMLKVPASELGNPMVLVIEVETLNRLFHGKSSVAFSARKSSFVPFGMRSCRLTKLFAFGPLG